MFRVYKYTHEYQCFLEIIYFCAERYLHLFIFKFKSKLHYLRVDKFSYEK